jgi:hypothetical protein
VWGTLSQIGSQYFASREREAERKTSIELAKVKAQTNAAPSGTPYWNFANPLPGLFSSYPQADTKPQPGAQAGMNGFLQANWLWLVLALLALLLFSRYARR